VEEIRICAFFDVLGTREIMLGEDEERRNSLIELVRKLSSNSSSYSANAENLGSAVIMRPSAQSISFSDNVAVSFPIKRLNIPGTVGNKPHTFFVEASSFFENILIQTIIAVWDGLKIGVLFRGGISVGRLVHDDEIIAGEALVKAVELEKETKWPRIEVSPEIIELADELGNPVVSDDIKRDCLEEIDGKWFVKSLALQIGYWRDHNWYREQEGLPPEEIPIVLRQIKSKLDLEFKHVMDGSNQAAIDKWKWFMPALKKAFESGNWNLIPGAHEAICGKGES